MSEEPNPDVSEAIDTIEEALAEAELPFGRYVVKLLIERALGPALVSAVTGAGAAAVGWYAIGQQQVVDRVEAEVEMRDRVRALLEEAMKRDTATATPLLTVPMLIDTPEPAPETNMEELREMWEKRYGPKLPADGSTDGGTDGVDEVSVVPTQQMPFPRELVQTKLNAIRSANQ